MVEVIKHVIGIFVLTIGFFIGSYLAKITKEELKSGQKWFKTIIIISLAGSIISIFLKNDYYFYSFLFITIVTSRSLKN